MVAQYYGDGTGVTMEQLVAAKEILEFTFTNNIELEYFDEFRFFTNIQSTHFSLFNGCTKLKSVSFPDQMTEIYYYSCKICI